MVRHITLRSICTIEETYSFAYQKVYHYDTPVGMQPPPRLVSSEEKRLYFSAHGLAALKIGQTDVEQEDVRWREAEEEIVEVADRLKAASLKE